jgi:hypothetical protein
MIPGTMLLQSIYQAYTNAPAATTPTYQLLYLPAAQTPEPPAPEPNATVDVDNAL